MLAYIRVSCYQEETYLNPFGINYLDMSPTHIRLRTCELYVKSLTPTYGLASDTDDDASNAIPELENPCLRSEGPPGFKCDED